VFNWKQFCDDHRIHYVTNGPNTKAGEISIRCPACGDDDPSQHLGLNLKTGKWGCWRNHAHRGIRPHRLIMRLLGCSFEVADGFVTGGRELSNFDRMAQEFLQATASRQNDLTLEFPDEFKPLTDKGRGHVYVQYLRDRSFSERAAVVVSSRFNLMYCDRGYWRGRIIFPIWYMSELVSWTGRTIYRSEELRYMSLSDKEPKFETRDPQPLALMNVKNLVWNFDDIVSERWRVVAVVEGPMDAIKTDYYGYEHGIRAICLFGTGITGHQKLLLEEVRECCDELIIIPDAGALANEMDLKSALVHLRPKVLRVPTGVEDPGAFTKKSFTQVFKAFLH